MQNRAMPNIASVLKDEIARVARREMRATLDSLRKTSTSQRAEIAALKRRVHELERQVAKKARDRGRAKAESPIETTGMRFRAAGMAANRERLGLTARQFGVLVGVSAQVINAWEQGKTKPDREQLAAVAALRGITKQHAVERLAAAAGG